MQLIVYSAQNDGNVERYFNGASWLATHDNANGVAIDSTSSYMGPKTNKYGANYFQVVRGFLLFDTSPLTINAIIDSAEIALHGYTPVLGAEAQAGYADMGLFEGVQHSPLELGDYGSHLSKVTLGIESYFDFGDWASAYRTKALNATGISWINKTGYTFFCLRNYSDVNSLEPTGNNQMNCYSESSAYKPRLTIEYHLPPGGFAAELISGGLI